MIIFGTRTSHSTDYSQPFQCPRCNMQRNGVVKSAKRWFTLYFIPVIPLGTIGQFVECDACAGTWGVEVLSYNPEADRAQLLDMLRHVLVLLLASSGKLGQDRVRRLIDLFAEVSGQQLDEAVVQQELRYAHEARVELGPFIAGRVGALSDNGKAWLFQAGAKLLSDSGTYSGNDRELIRTLGRSLGIEPQQLQHTLAT